MKLIIFALAIGVFSCSSKIYNQDSVKIIDVQLTNDSIILFYSPKLETLYYSPGLNYSYSEKRDSVYIQVLRSKIKKQPSVMCESILITEESDSALFNQYGTNVYYSKIPNNFDKAMSYSDIKARVVIRNGRKK